VAAALNVGLPARTKMLTIDGLDVLKQPGGAAYGVDVATIQVSEAGAGQVSSMTFLITDPTAALTITTGSRVSFWDITANLPIFTGFVDSFSASRLGVGREIAVQCVGVEAVLDWMIIPSLTLNLGTSIPVYTLVQAVVAAAQGIGVSLNVACSPGLNNTTAFPVGDSLEVYSPATTPLTFTGVTLRQALQSIAIAGASDPALATISSPITFDATVDMFGGLRYGVTSIAGVLAALSNFGGSVGDIGLDITTGNPRPSNTSYTVTASEYQAVYVNGGNAAGTLAVATGGVGPTAYVSDPNSLSAAYAQALGYAYLAQHGGSAQGTVQIEERKTVANAYATGGLLRLTDPQVGLTVSTPFRVTRIDKTYLASGTEWWIVSFGAMQRLGSTQLRSLTRTQLS
jgi:hypothetical protein